MKLKLRNPLINFELKIMESLELKRKTVVYQKRKSYERKEYNIALLKYCIYVYVMRTSFYILF